MSFNPNKVHIISNGYESADLPESFARCDQELRLCYTGMLYGRYEAMEILLQVLSECIHEGAKNIVLHYAGSEGSRLEKLLTGTSVGVVDHGFIPRAQAIDLQKKSDILVALAWNAPGSTGILSGKFFEYMALKKPIISIVTGSLPNAEITRMVRDLNLGIACEQVGGNASREELKAYLLMQYRLKCDRQELVFEADSAEVAKYNYTHLTQELERLCLSVIQAKEGAL